VSEHKRRRVIIDGRHYHALSLVMRAGPVKSLALQTSELSYWYAAANVALTVSGFKICPI